MAVKPIPVILVTGFLGSGKTTLLLALAKAHPERRMIFLVNEFAGEDVDGEILAGSGISTRSVVGGSLFCECKSQDFINVLEETVLPEQEAAALDALVIETSGIADPEAIGTLLGAHGLEDRFRVRHIVTVVAPKRFPSLVDNLPVAAAQIRGSDLVVLNKVDLAPMGKLAETRERVQRLNPEARVVEAQYCAIPFDFVERPGGLAKGDLSTFEANPFTAKTVYGKGAVPVAKLQDWLADLPDCIHRVKGSVLTDAGWRRVEKTPDDFHLAEGPARETAGLVLIAPDEDEAELAGAIGRLEEIFDV